MQSGSNDVTNVNLSQLVTNITSRSTIFVKDVA